MKKKIFIILQFLLEAFLFLFLFYIRKDLFSSVSFLIFSLISLYASKKDIREREIPDFIHVMILILGVLYRLSYSPISLISGLFSGFLISLILFIPILVIKKDFVIGGGDVKYIIAASFFLGIRRGLLGLLIGFLIGIISELCKKKIKKESFNMSFPLIPYLNLGYILSIVSLELINLI